MDGRIGKGWRKQFLLVRLAKNVFGRGIFSKGGMQEGVRLAFREADAHEAAVGREFVECADSLELLLEGGRCDE